MFFCWHVCFCASGVHHAEGVYRLTPQPEASLWVDIHQLATFNGICEETLWRGLYVRAFPNNPWLAILFPAAGFAVWHLAPLGVFHEGGVAAFIVSTFFLGLAYGFIAYKTGSAKWTAISHSLNGILALSGMLAPSLLALIERR